MGNELEKTTSGYVEKDDLCQISLTGMRALVLCGLLIESPLSLKEIREAFINFRLIQKEHSFDTLRTDINTLKAFGCNISRCSVATNNKYVLSDYPFRLQLDKDELNTIKRAYNKIKNELDITTLLAYDSLFQKIAKYIPNNEIKESLLGISLLKTLDKEKLQELLEDCKYNRIVTLVYKAPNSKYEREKEILTQRLVFKNDKVYLYGYDFSLKEAVTLKFKRILKILSRRDNDKDIKLKNITVKFILQEFGPAGLLESENIVGRTSSGYLIVGNYHNNFVAVQRILSFGPACTVIEPEDFRNRIITVLSKMKEMYNG